MKIASEVLGRLPLPTMTRGHFFSDPDRPGKTCDLAFPARTDEQHHEFVFDIQLRPQRLAITAMKAIGLDAVSHEVDVVGGELKCSDLAGTISSSR